MPGRQRPDDTVRRLSEGEMIAVRDPVQAAWELMLDEPPPDVLQPRTKYVLTTQLKVDPSYQRIVNQAEVAAIGEDWDWQLVQVLLVSLRADGGCYVIDGQTRFGGAQKAQIKYLPAIVFTGLTRAQEAALFVKINGWRRAVHMLDRFRGAEAAGHHVALEIQAAAEHYGFRVGYSGSPATITSVQPLEYARYWRCLDDVFRVCAAAWPTRPLPARSRTVLLALAAFNANFKDGYDEALFVKAMRDLSLPVLIQEANKGIGDDHTHYTVRSAWARLAARFQREYNRKAGKRDQLPPFEQPDLPQAANVLSRGLGRRSKKQTQAIRPPKATATTPAPAPASPRHLAIATARARRRQV